MVPVPAGHLNHPIQDRCLTLPRCRSICLRVLLRDLDPGSQRQVLRAHTPSWPSPTTSRGKPREVRPLSTRGIYVNVVVSWLQLIFFRSSQPPLQKPTNTFITAVNNAFRSRLDRTRNGSSGVVWVNVRQTHADSAHTNRGFTTINPTSHACGTSCTGCPRQARTRPEITPHLGQPSATVSAWTITRRPPKNKSIA